MDRTRIAIVIGVLATSSASLAQAPSDAQRAAERVRALQREADRLASESRTLIGDLRKLEIEQQINAETLAASEADVRTVTAALEKARQRMATLEARRHEATPALAAELVEIYKRGRRRHAQMLVASLADSRALGRLIRGAQALARIERARVDAHRRAMRAEQEAVRELERRLAEVAAARAAQLTARAALHASVAERNRLIEAIDRDRDLAARYAGELQSAPPSLPIAPFKGDLDWPVRGIVHSRFGSAAPGRPGSAIVRNGIELIATERSAVTAIHGGRVSYAAPFLGLGTLAVIDHGNSVQSLYGYLGELVVSAGTLVDRGSLVGRVGAAGLGRTGGATLYFELRVDGRPVDPLQWLRSSP